MSKITVKRFLNEVCGHKIMCDECKYNCGYYDDISSGHFEPICNLEAYKDNELIDY